MSKRSNYTGRELFAEGEIHGFVPHIKIKTDDGSVRDAVFDISSNSVDLVLPKDAFKKLKSLGLVGSNNRRDIVVRGRRNNTNTGRTNITIPGKPGRYPDRKIDGIDVAGSDVYQIGGENVPGVNTGIFKDKDKFALEFDFKYKKLRIFRYS